MSDDVLAIIGEPDEELELLEQLTRLRPRRVTVLIQRAGEARASTFARAVERRTGAAIVGLAGSREQLAGWRFDRVVGRGVEAALRRPARRPSATPSMASAR
jgi:hypothetical protein